MMEPGKIEIKDNTVMEGLLKKVFHPTLIEIVEWVVVRYGLTITESYRPKKHRNDLHGTKPVRAVDLRSWNYPQAMAYYIQDKINNKWVYDPNRPEKQVAILHNSGNGLHFHIQVHPRTRRR